MKTKQYTHINQQERLEIAYLKNKKGYGINAIAQILNRNKSSISEEIAGNSVNGFYDPRKAQHKAYVKRKYSKYQGMKIVQNQGLRNYVEEKIGNDWSPEQVAGRLQEVDTDIGYVSHTGIYKYIYSVYGRQLEQHLRYRGKKRKCRQVKSTLIKNRTFIDERPEIINSRERFGDWEGDLIVSGRKGEGVLLVLHERVTRFPVIRKIMSRKTDIINNCIYQITGGFVCFNSLTVDSDISFQKHQELSAMIQSPVYFCHPYHAWEKGGVENTNKLVRQYIPKVAISQKSAMRKLKRLSLNCKAGQESAWGIKHH